MKTTIEKDIKEQITSYPFDVVDGKIIACEYVKLACKRFIKFLDRDDMYFSIEKVQRVINFISKLKHFTGAFYNKPFLLQEWQKFIIMGIYGFYWKKNDLRVTRTFILSIARKSGKSSLMSALALYHLIADGEMNAEVTIAANSAKQAQILFKMAKDYLRSIDANEKFFKQYRDKILFEKTNSKIDFVSSDPKRLDGKNCSMVVVDEIAMAPNSEVYDVLESSMGSRTQPLMCCCSTRSFNQNGFYKELEDGAIQVLNDVRKDDSLFCLIYTLDKDDNWKTQKNWIKCQPGLNETVSVEFMKQQVVKAKNSPTQEISIRTKIFNEWQTSSSGWISMDYIYKASKPVNLEDYKGQFCYCGVDLASVSDICALSLLIPMEDKYIFKSYAFLPESALENNVNSQIYKKWANQNYLLTTKGNVTDYNEVTKKLQQINEICPITKIFYDKWNATQWASDATSKGLFLEPYSQSIGSMNRPSKELMRLLMSDDGRIILDNSPVTIWCYSNCVAVYDINENLKITKNEHQTKIDVVISQLMALGGYLNEEKWDNTIEVFNY